MKGRSKTKAEIKLHDDLRDMGCCVCRFIVASDIPELQVPAIHHIEGKTKEGAHSKVIPLCSLHHQYGTKEHPSIHANGSAGGKAAFKSKYGVDEHDLIGMCEEHIGREYSEVAA